MGVDCPFVARVYDVRLKDDDIVLTSQFVTGQPFDKIEEFHDRQFMCEAMCQVLTGLQAFQKAKVVHNDIRPANLVLTDDGYACLIDFDRIALSGKKPTRSSCFGYSSPEQLRGDVVDWRSDLFAAGVVLCEALSGSRPYPGNDLLSYVYSVTAGEMKCPGDMGEQEWSVISKMCAFDPAERFFSFSEARDCIIPLACV
jgi:serine/threonine-protein kinase